MNNKLSNNAKSLDKITNYVIRNCENNSIRQLGACRHDKYHKKN